MKLRRTLLSSAIAIGLLSSTTVMHAGVPVVDAAANAQLITGHLETIAQWGKEAAKWGKDYQHYASQLLAYKTQLEDLRSGNYAGLLQSFAGDYFTEGGAISGMLFGTYGGTDTEAAAKKYLGEANACATGVEGEENTANYKACTASRNMQAQAMQDMEKMLKDANKRTEEIQKLVASSRTKGMEAGVLQQKAIEMMGLQALLQNDLAKLQLTIEMHKQREKLYAQEQVDQAMAVLKGDGKAVSLESVLNGLN